MDILDVIITNVKSFFGKFKDVYSFVIENFLPGLNSRYEPSGFEFF